MLDRRDFIRAMAAVSATATLGRAAPSDRLRLGLIGSGPRGRNVMNGFLGFPDVEVPVICDVIEPQMATTVKALLEKRPDATKPDQVVDSRRVLDRRDLDGVIIATTEHWHGLPAIHAAQAGKAIFVEKVEEVPAVPGEQDRVWQRTFVDCVKERKTPPVTLEEGHQATACCQLGNIAYHTGRRIHWDGTKEQIVGDEEASRLLKRPRRKGYELPKV